MSKGGVGETPQQRALADYATQQLGDYKQRWLPVQQMLAAHIESIGRPDSYERRAAAGKANVDTSMSFDRAQGALEKSLSNAGVNVGSSRNKLAVAGMGEDQAKTTGIGHMITDQQIDNAYTQGLQALTAIGRGEKANVTQGMAAQAQESAATAQASAQASEMERAGAMGAAGQAAGMGLYASLNKPPVQPPQMQWYG